MLGTITTRNGVAQNEYIRYMAGIYENTETTIMKKTLKCTLNATCDLQVFLILMALRTCLPGSSKNSIQEKKKKHRLIPSEISNKIHN